jgi:hypothetical protein
VGYARSILELLEREIAFLEAQARLADALRHSAVDADDRRRQEQARDELLRKADLLRRSGELIRESTVRPEPPARES